MVRAGQARHPPGPAPGGRAARLAQRLDRCFDGPLTLITAPAGFGKTTLAAHWSAAQRAVGRAVAWVALDAGDTDPTHFWAYVVAALRPFVPDDPRRPPLSAARSPRS